MKRILFATFTLAFVLILLPEMGYARSCTESTEDCQPSGTHPQRCWSCKANDTSTNPWTEYQEMACSTTMTDNALKTLAKSRAMQSCNGRPVTSGASSCFAMAESEGPSGSGPGSWGSGGGKNNPGCAGGGNHF